MASPLEHDVVILEEAGLYAIRRAIGVGLNTRHLDGPPSTATIRAEAIALGEEIARMNGVDLWIVAGKDATRLTKHRSHGPTTR